MHPKSVILFSITVPENWGKKLLDFFPLKIVQGKYFNIFHRTIVVYLYYNCHQDPYPPPIQRAAAAADVVCVVFFLHEDVTCIVNDGSLCLLRLDLKVGGKRNSSEQSCYWSCHTGTLWHRQSAHKAIGINNMKFLLGQVKGSLVKITFFPPFFTYKLMVTTGSDTMTYRCHGIDCVRAMSGGHSGGDISVFFC